MATSATRTSKKSCKPVEFVHATKNGFPYVGIEGIATFHLRDKLKKNGARWNPVLKQWQIWGSSLEMALMQELEADAQAALPMALAFQEKKLAKNREEVMPTETAGGATALTIASASAASASDTAATAPAASAAAATAPAAISAAADANASCCECGPDGCLGWECICVDWESCGGIKCAPPSCLALSRSCGRGAASMPYTLSDSPVCRDCMRCELMPGQSCKVPHCMTTNCGLCNEVFKTQKGHVCPEMEELS
jgi:hypothetical protein